jgi:hypothetical protein
VALKRFAWFAALFGAFVLWMALRDPRVEGDTRVLLSGAQAARQCLAAGVTRGCPGTLHFPVFQYVPAYLQLAAGRDEAHTLRFLVYLNALAFWASVVLTLAFLWRAGKPRLAWLMGLFWLTSPFWGYAHSSYNEASASFVTLLAVVVALSGGAAPWLFGSVVLASVTKEVAPPFIVALAGLALFFEAGGARALWSRRRWRALAIVLAGGVGMAINLAFNIFRFGSFRNEMNLVPEFQVPSLGQHLENLAGLLVSPNGGVLFFVPLFLPLLMALLARPSAGRRIYAAGIGLLFAALVAGFAKWYAPFGWVAWGPRLLLPWLPTLFFSLLVYFADETEILLGRGFAKLRAGDGIAWMAVVALVALALPQFGAAYAHEAFGQWFAPQSWCPQPVAIQADPAGYYACINGGMWTLRPWILWTTAIEALRVRHWALTLPYLAVLIGWIWGGCRERRAS